MSDQNNKSVFDEFTGKYSLSKTLRFELKPVPRTLEHMRKHLEYDKKLQTFLKDQRIEDAYQVLKPLVDELHEEFITDSLQSETARKIGFSKYVNKKSELVKLQIKLKKLENQKKNNHEIDNRELKDLEKKVSTASKDLESYEKNYRNQLGECFIKAGDFWKKDKYPKYDWKKGSTAASGSAILSSQDLLKLIGDKNEKNEKIQNVLKVFEGFFTYLSGFNQNRENYYETKKEASTAVATRIVHENLPKFCDNSIIYASRKEEYLRAYDILKDLGRELVDRDQVPLNPISAEIFEDNYFNKCLSQAEIEEYNNKIGKANFLINLYNQSKKNGKNFSKLKSFKTLYKQIGCGKKKPLFFTLTHERKQDAVSARQKNPDKQYFSVEEILEIATLAGRECLEKSSVNGQIETIPDFIQYIKDKESFEGVYWSKAALNTISNKYFADWFTLKEKLKEAKVFKKAPKGSKEDVITPPVIELSELFDVLDSTENESWKEGGVFFKKSITEVVENSSREQKNAGRKEIIANAEKPSQALMQFILEDTQVYLDNFLEREAGNVERTSRAYFSAEGKDQEEKKRQWKEAIKAWIDSACTANAMLKYFLVKEDKIKGNPLDSEISNGLKRILFESKVTIDSWGEETVNWFRWRDALRNFLTKRPQDDAKENKLKLNFENGSLLKGWDKDLESQRKSIILKDLNYYYLLILAEKHGSVLNNSNNLAPNGDEKTIEKMYFKQQTKVFRQLPRLGFPYKVDKEKPLLSGDKENFDHAKFLERVEKYGLNKEIISIKDDFDFFQSEKNKGDAFPFDKLKVLIDYYKKIIQVNYQKIFPIGHILETDYEDLNNFYEDFEKAAYDLIFKPISKKYIDDLVESGKAYQFIISNKDFSNKANGRKNLHTIFFKSLFSDPEKNIQLGANAQVFFRQQAIKLKKKKEGYEGKEHIITLKRFTEEKFLLHFTISINAQSIDGISNGNPNPQAIKVIQELVDKKISEHQDVCFLGLDRGEKHLAYYSLVDKNGKLVKQGTLNLSFVDKDGKPRSVKAEKRTIGDDGKEIVEVVECWNYNELLAARAGDRDYARKNWQTIGSIKNLKEGYISQVVRTVADLATKDGKPTYIVLEDLNTGFKRSRQKIEKSVYQKFEVSLAKKLNFLVDKSAENGELGSVTKALQLTPPVNNYGDIEKKSQAGIILYTRPNYTSQTDPATGWRKSIYLKKGSEQYIRDQILGNKERELEKNEKEFAPAFSEIGFDGTNYFFVYSDKNTGKEWTLYSGYNGKSIPRFHNEKNSKGKWVPQLLDVVEILDQIFSTYDKSRSLLLQMKEDKKLTKLKEDKYSKYTAWESLRFAIDMIQQIRNTGITERDNDFIFSPVRNENDEHFDSRLYWDKEKQGEKVNMPSSGDANGAYNIARKGIIMNEHIKNDLQLFISDEEWDVWLAGKDKWEEWLKKNKDRLRKKKNE